MAHPSQSSSGWDQKASVAHTQACCELHELIPRQFKTKTGRNGMSLWHATIKYIDHLSDSATITAFDIDPNTASGQAYRTKNLACRDLLAEAIPQRYHEGRDGMRTTVARWSVEYIRDLITARSRQMQTREIIDEHPSAIVVPLDEDGVLDAMAELQELLSTDEEEPGKLMVLAESKTAEWGKAGESIENFVSIGDTDLDGLLEALAGLRTGFAKELQEEGKLNTKGLLGLAKAVERRVDEIYEALRKLLAWFDVGLEEGEDGD